MDKDSIIHDLAVSAATISTYYNKQEIDEVKDTERMAFIATDIAMRYKECYKVIEKCYLDGDII